MKLVDMLNETGVNPAHYSVGKIEDNSYVLLSKEKSWEVFFYERGMISSLNTFKKESDACKYLFERLTGPNSALKRMGPAAPPA